jgi:hypothetical protein
MTGASGADHRQRDAIPAALGRPLLAARRGNRARGGQLPRESRRSYLGDRRDEPPATGPRAGSINRAFDNDFLDRLASDPQALRRITRYDYLREAGSEGIELIMWLIMRGALGADVTERHRFYHVPASNTAVGHMVLEPA